MQSQAAQKESLVLVLDTFVRELDIALQVEVEMKVQPVCGMVRGHVEVVVIVHPVVIAELKYRFAQTNFPYFKGLCGTPEIV